MRRSLVVVLLAFAAPVWGQNATYVFEWSGANGHTMTGALSFDAALIGQGLVREQDVSCFEIEGRREDDVLGQWRLGMLTSETTWRLFFDPIASAFVVEGQGIRMPQAWNMNGAGDDCGIPGFGFNLGNLGQDFCIDNKPIIPSRVEPEQPFPAFRRDAHVFSRGACHMPDLLSQLHNKAAQIPR